MTDAVRFEGVSKRFGATTAVDDLNLTVRQGEFFSLLGPSGCGKTTTLRMVAGFEQPTEGSIFLDDEPVAGRAAVPAQRQHGVPELRAVQHLNVQGNVAFGLKRRKVRGAGARER